MDVAVAELVRERPHVPDEVRHPERAGAPRTAVGVDVVGPGVDVPGRALRAAGRVVGGAPGVLPPVATLRHVRPLVAIRQPPPRPRAVPSGLGDPDVGDGLVGERGREHRAAVAAAVLKPQFWTHHRIARPDQHPVSLGTWWNISHGVCGVVRIGQGKKIKNADWDKKNA